ncbi:hypothetical protein FZ103_09465 [Streptomonospora sp. PA3]|nr:hypothetical protein [Streptomonospora sp. PA3]
MVPGQGATGITTSFAVLDEPLGSGDVAQRAIGSRPVMFSDARVDLLHVHGSGVWIDEDSVERSEPRLVDLLIGLDPPHGAWAQIAVHHDVWTWFDFHGNPHRVVYENNAPRLEAALKSVEAELGVTAEAGDPTVFGCPEGYGIAPPEPDEEVGPDLSSRL